MERAMAQIGRGPQHSVMTELKKYAAAYKLDIAVKGVARGAHDTALIRSGPNPDESKGIP